MIEYPFLKDQPTSRKVIDIFKGYNHNLRIGDGEFYEMENMTSDDYPVLSTRRKRGKVVEIPGGGYASGGIYVPGRGLFLTVTKQTEQGAYYDEEGELDLLNDAGELSKVQSLTPGKKTFALMGKNLIVAPDMYRIDIDSLDFGYMRYAVEKHGGTFGAELCQKDGSLYTNCVSSPSEPSSLMDQMVWVDTSTSPYTAKQYSITRGEWVTLSTTYVKIWDTDSRGLFYNHQFNENDGITISGLEGSLSCFNGSHIVQSVDHGHDEIVIVGIIDNRAEARCSVACFERKVPTLDFIVESGNRLWGCAKGTNEIYACKLGDYRNWNCFQGLSTDSWVGTVGTPGEFTGAVVQNGCPIFYKENYKHKVWPSATGAHQITVTECNGVEKGSESSLAVLNGTVFYKSPFGICADDGGGAVEIGDRLGDVGYTNAAGAIYDQKYYLNMSDSSGKYHLFVYDISRNLWYRENSLSPGHLASGGSRLYTASGGDIWDLTGSTGTPEGTVAWMVQTGDLGLELPEQKYISRLTLRLSLEPGATLEIYAQYDQEPVWQKLGQVYGTDLRSFSLPVRPRRCDQLRLKLQGTGMCKIYSITKTLEKGSELV